MNPLEMWGGLECTLNRVGDRFIDQCEKNGHYQRLSDLTLFRDLGIRKLRYPCLWEKVAPHAPHDFNWDYLDERLEELRNLGLPVIAGLLHHGSGPSYTNLTDPDFPVKFAVYARAFAERFPWIKDFTPINEIVTTARFSCLYGHWFPHLSNELSFYQAVINQCKATILAMGEIRKFIPSARLIQTDDIGRCQSTEPLKYQQDYENERRWLGFDLLAGKLNKAHPLYQRMISNGILEEELAWFEENRCPPDLIGMNHYFLSNRFLDHRLDIYPAWSHGGNGLHTYADVGAIDTGQCTPPTPLSILLEIWDRYHLPIAVTEVHARGHREDQLRWLHQVWKAALSARDAGADVQAVTAWSLLGTYDWNSLCTKCDQFYEPGVFDLRNPDKKPQPTVVSKLVNCLASGNEFSNQIVEAEGYWETPRRILWGVQQGGVSSLDYQSRPRPVLITGARGTLGQAFAKTCGARNIPYKLLSRREMDITEFDSVRKVIEELDPWAIINAAGYVDVDRAEEDKYLCYRENVDGAVNLALIAAVKGMPFVTFSSDLVFDGHSENGYVESHPCNPLNHYGLSKRLSEERVLQVNPQALIIRTSAFFGPWDDYNFVTIALRELALNRPFQAAADIRISPTYVPDLANETLNLLQDGETGIIHLTNQGVTTWAELACRAVEMCQSRFNINPKGIIRKKATELNFKATRPKNSFLRSERLHRLPSIEDALERYFKELNVPISHLQKEMNP